MHHPHNHPPFRAAAENPEAMRVWGGLFRTMHLQRVLMGRKLADHGTHPGQAACLREIGHNEGITQRDLATALHITPPAVTVMVQKMERANLVRRVTDASDQRRTLLYLTEEGYEKHNEMHELLGEVIDSTIMKLTTEEQAELARLLGRLADTFEAEVAAAGDPIGFPAPHGTYDVPEEGTDL